jgi:hypothetical protein
MMQPFKSNAMLTLDVIMSNYDKQATGDSLSSTHHAEGLVNPKVLANFFGF